MFYYRKYIFLRISLMELCYGVNMKDLAPESRYQRKVLIQHGLRNVVIHQGLFLVLLKMMHQFLKRRLQFAFRLTGNSNIYVNGGIIPGADVLFTIPGRRDIAVGSLKDQQRLALVLHKLQLFIVVGHMGVESKIFCGPLRQDGEVSCQQSVSLRDNGGEGMLFYKFEDIGVIDFLVFPGQIHFYFFCEGKDISSLLQLFGHYIAWPRWPRGNPEAWDLYLPAGQCPVPLSSALPFRIVSFPEAFRTAGVN